MLGARSHAKERHFLGGVLIFQRDDGADFCVIRGFRSFREGFALNAQVIAMVGREQDQRGVLQLLSGYGHRFVEVDEALQGGAGFTGVAVRMCDQQKPFRISVRFSSGLLVLLFLGSFVLLGASILSRLLP